MILVMNPTKTKGVATVKAHAVQREWLKGIDLLWMVQVG